MKKQAKSAAAYVAAIPDDRRDDVERLRALVKEAVPQAIEGMVWGMLGYAIGERPFVAIGSHKTYMSLYLLDFYTQPSLRKKYEKALAGVKIGRSCINFQSVDELPLDAIKAILAEAPNVRVEGGTMAKKKMVKPAPKKTPTRPRARA
jgi:hypothetical protein